jgi:DNA polymerase-3 subunit epsilon
LYAILDIETTGGQYNEEGITEIAIYKFNGHQVVDKFISLVNPEREIQPFVVNLTGINSKMLRNAPKFYEVAKRIIEITDGCILVAHNSQFDYRILRTEFKRLGFDFKRKSLCTVELSKKLIPGQKSYSLGKLARSLGIPVSDRHRANGDTLATLKLFKMLLAKDSGKAIIKETVKAENVGQLSPKLQDIVAQLPTSTGVYYIHKEDGSIIYIGKSKNIKKRVNQHFTATTRKGKNIQKQVVAVTYEETGNELIALLKESEEIKINKPIYNRAQRKTLFNYALYAQQNNHGYLSLYIDKADGRKQIITAFSSLEEGKRSLYKITDEYKLCQKINKLDNGHSHCFSYGIKNCNGACNLEETPEIYNQRAQQVLLNKTYPSAKMMIIDKGRTVDERSVILIEDGEYKGFGFYNLNHQINNIEIIRSVITPMKNTRDIQHIIQSYLKKRKVLKIIEF